MYDSAPRYPTLAKSNDRKNQFPSESTLGCLTRQNEIETRELPPEALCPPIRFVILVMFSIPGEEKTREIKISLQSSPIKLANMGKRVDVLSIHQKIHGSFFNEKLGQSSTTHRTKPVFDIS